MLIYTHYNSLARLSCRVRCPSTWWNPYSSRILPLPTQQIKTCINLFSTIKTTTTPSRLSPHLSSSLFFHLIHSQHPSIILIRLRQLTCKKSFHSLTRMKFPIHIQFRRTFMNTTRDELKTRASQLVAPGPLRLVIIASLTLSAVYLIFISPPTSSIRLTLFGLYRFLTTLSMSMLIIADYKFLHWWYRDKDEHDVEYVKEIAKVHERSAIRLLWLSKFQGGIYIKVKIKREINIYIHQSCFFLLSFFFLCYNRSSSFIFNIYQ